MRARERPERSYGRDRHVLFAMIRMHLAEEESGQMLLLLVKQLAQV